MRIDPYTVARRAMEQIRNNFLRNINRNEGITCYKAPECERCSRFVERSPCPNRPLEPPVKIEERAPCGRSCWAALLIALTRPQGPRTPALAAQGPG